MSTFAGTLLKIDNQSVPGLRDYEVRYEKIWASRSRNMSGELRGSLLGIDASIRLTFGGDLREDDVAGLATKLNQDYFGVTFFDPNSQTTKTAQYYCGDYGVRLIDKLKGRYETISIDLYPVSRYS